ncbi:MAG: tetrahydrofolate dehydrogenase/cyclohydrolase catalytic domain-containing protein, partial [Gordonia amarae]
MSSPETLSGTELAAQINAETAARARALSIVPTLATVLVGEDPGSRAYVAMKQRRCAEFGLGARHVELPSATTTAELAAVLSGLSA